MNSIRVSSTLVALVLISGLANTKRGDTGSLLEDCKFRGNMCAVNGSCIERLRKERLVENCDALVNEPEKSLYIEESLSFHPHPFAADYFLAENWTYSVFLSDDMSWKNLHLVDGCCNMKGDDKCSMPATFDKDKTFLVVFPYKDSERRKYCWSIVHYGDAPIDLCKEGKPIIHPCISIEDEGKLIKTRYQPLGRPITTPFDRCYFTVPKQEIQVNDNAKYEELFLDVEYECATHPIIHIHATDYQCEIQKNISEEKNEELISGVYDKGNGDFVCYVMKPPWSQLISFSGICFYYIRCTPYHLSDRSPTQKKSQNSGYTWHCERRFKRKSCSYEFGTDNTQ